MALLSTSVADRRQQSARGFSLLELVVVVALFSSLLALGMFLSMDMYRTARAQSGRDQIINALILTRSRAQATYHDSAAGICMEGNDLVYFYDEWYLSDSPTNEREPLAPDIRISSDFFSCDEGGLIFTPHTATTTGGVLTVTQDGRTATEITTNREGSISAE